MSGPLRTALRNILVIARREFLWRGRSRTFLITTAFLVVVAVAVGLAPTILRFVDRLDTGDRIGVVAGDAAPTIDLAPALGALLNASTASSVAGTKDANPAGYIVVAVPDLAAARAEVGAGTLKAVLALERTPSGDLAYTLYSGMKPFDRTAQLIQQAATALAMQDRLSRAGIPPGDQAALFAPAAFTFASADPAAGGKAEDTVEETIGHAVLGFALPLLIFMAIVMYGQWVAMSVAEEKSSRVMELVLGAAKPIELLTGKVVGVGGLGLAQYAAVFVPAALAILFQDRIASLVLGGSGSIGLPTGVTVPLLVAFGIFFVLGYALYATLFAGVASLVSRQEDVSQLITPLILVSTAGYMIAVYSSSGLIPIDSPLVVILSFVPFVSPYLMLDRMAAGEVGLVEPTAAIAILLASIVAALWVGGRLYAAGVLMYGQKPGLHNLLHAFRSA